MRTRISRPHRLHRLKKWPHEYLALPREERAMVIASIQLKSENDRKEARKLRFRRKS